MSLAPEQLELIQKQAQERRERAREIAQRAAYDIVYIPEDRIFARFYVDSEGEYVRSIYRHKYGKATAAQCLGPGKCDICRHLDEAPDWGGKWRFRSREINICYAWIDEYLGPESKFVKLQQPILLMGNFKLGVELSKFLSDIGREGISEFFDPETPYFRVRMHLRDKGKDFDFFLLPNKRIAMSPLPPTLPPLSQCIFPESRAPQETLVKKFLRMIDESYEASLKSPSTQDRDSQPDSDSDCTDSPPWDDEENGDVQSS